MKKYNKVKMRHGNVNHSFGVPKERQERNEKRYGNLFNSLDFRIQMMWMLLKNLLCPISDLSYILQKPIKDMVCHYWILFRREMLV